MLDVGSGTGVFLPFLVDAVGPDGEVYALDISSAMLEQSKPKGFSRVRYVCAPVERIPLGDNVFDAVVCYNSFPHFVDKAACVREMARVLKEGGLLVIADLQNREALNQYHSRKSPVIAHDFLPHDAAMRSFAESAGLTGTTIDDGARGYTLVALKASGIGAALPPHLV